MSLDIFRLDYGLIDDAGDIQTLEAMGMPGEQLRLVSRIQQHGFASHPPIGAHGLGLAMLGRRDMVASIGGELAGLRPRNLPRGATAFYDAHGKIMKMVETKTDFDGGDKDFRQRKVKRVQLDADTEYWIKPAVGASVFLGAAGPFYPVVTTAGPSQHVFAAIGPAGPSTATGVE